MAKVIKFNLVVDGQRCRSIADIQENFNIIDLLELFKDGRLTKWLKNRKETDYLNKVNHIDLSQDDVGISLSLCEIFQINTSEEAIKQELAIIDEIRSGAHSDEKEIIKSVIDKLNIIKSPTPAAIVNTPVCSEGDISISSDFINTLVENCIKGSEKSQIKMITHPDCPAIFLDHLMDNYRNIYFPICISKHNNISQQVIDKLIKKHNFHIYINLISNPATSIKDKERSYFKILEQIQGGHDSGFYKTSSVCEGFTSIHPRYDYHRLEDKDELLKTVKDLYKEHTSLEPDSKIEEFITSTDNIHSANNILRNTLSKAAKGIF